jgi:hypothetical protein
LHPGWLCLLTHVVKLSFVQYESLFDQLVIFVLTWSVSKINNFGIFIHAEVLRVRIFFWLFRLVFFPRHKFWFNCLEHWLHWLVKVIFKFFNLRLLHTRFLNFFYIQDFFNNWRCLLKWENFLTFFNFFLFDFSSLCLLFSVKSHLLVKPQISRNFFSDS